MIPFSDKRKELRRQIEKLYRQKKALAELNSPRSIKLVSDAKKFMATMAKKYFNELKICDLINLAGCFKWFKFLDKLSEFNCLIEKHSPARIERIRVCTNKKLNFLRRYAFDQLGVSFKQFDIICQQAKFKMSNVTFTQNILDKYLNREE